MGLFGNLFRKKRWVCQSCNRIYGELKVVYEVNSPVNYAIDGDINVIFQILKCPGCGKHLVTGPYPLECSSCGRTHDGVFFVINEGWYGTYCKHCQRRSYSEEIIWDKNGVSWLDTFIEMPGYGGTHRYKKIRVLPTFGPSDNLWWR